MSVPEPPSINTTGPTTIWEYADLQAQQAKTCSACGSALVAGAHTCPKCGMKQATAQVEPSLTSQIAFGVLDGMLMFTVISRIAGAISS